MSYALSQPVAAARAFDSIAANYDTLFTHSLIGRAQRAQVWRAMERIFAPGDHVLELNCGTGEDALFLARRGVSVLACDASSAMIAIARERISHEKPGTLVRLEHLPSEDLDQISRDLMFEGVFSNFSGLNCVSDLRGVARQLALRTLPGTPALLCMSTRVCVWEVFWYLAHLQPRRAFRRCRGQAEAKLNEKAVTVYYPMIKQLRAAFAPWFTLRSFTAVGLLVPPTYVESWARKHPRLFSAMIHFDQSLIGMRLLRVLGDHVLLYFERTSA